MRKLLILAATLAVCVPIQGAWAQRRQEFVVPRYNAPQFVPRIVPRAFVPRQQFIPRPQFTPQQRFVSPGISRPGFRPTGPLRERLRQLNRSRNWTNLAVIPGLSYEFDQFVDSIDVTAPQDPITGCGGSCPNWGAISVSLDGVAGLAWNYPTAQDAMAAAQQKCVESASQACGATIATGGSTWAAGLFCTNGANVQTSTSNGNDGPSAISNAYKHAASLGWSPDSCILVGLVAADGSQQAQNESE